MGTVKSNKNFPKRKSIRLRNYDYSSAGVYFITICTKDRKNYFWQPKEIYSKFIVNNIIRPYKIPLSKYGRIAERKLLNIPRIYKRISVSSFVIMPNHIHMLLTVGFNQKYNNSTVLSVTQDKASITRVVKQFKGAVSKEVGFSVWQKSFYDHIVRSEKDLAKMWQYIKSNPLLWEDDCFRKIR